MGYWAELWIQWRDVLLSRTWFQDFCLFSILIPEYYMLVLQFILCTSNLSLWTMVEDHLLYYGNSPGLTVHPLWDSWCSWHYEHIALWIFQNVVCNVENSTGKCRMCLATEELWNFDFQTWTFDHLKHVALKICSILWNSILLNLITIISSCSCSPWLLIKYIFCSFVVRVFTCVVTYDQPISFSVFTP